MRQLVPVISPAAEQPDPHALLTSATINRDPNSPFPAANSALTPLPDDYSIEDANADFFS